MEPANREVTTPAAQQYIRILVDAAKPLHNKAAVLWLLFFKRICDRLEEERQPHGAKPGEQIPPAHRLVVPPYHSWANLRNTRRMLVRH